MPESLVPEISEGLHCPDVYDSVLCLTNSGPAIAPNLYHIPRPMSSLGHSKLFADFKSNIIMADYEHNECKAITVKLTQV